MAEVTRVPLQPIAGGSLAKLWIGIVVAILLAGGIAWAAVPQGLDIDVISEGTGESPQMGDIVFVRYSGRLENGEVFDQSQQAQWPIPGILPDGTPMALQEGALIPGFLEALTQTRKGGEYEVFIPADQAYGDSPPEGAPIPPNANLIFNIEVVDILSEEEANQRYMTMMQMLQQSQGAPGGEGAAPQVGPAQ